MQARSGGPKSCMSMICFLVLPAGHRDHGRAELLAAVVQAEAAGEEPVAVRHLQDVVGRSPAASQRAGHSLRPDVDVLLRVADHGRLAGRAGRGVDSHDIAHRRGE